MNDLLQSFVGLAVNRAQPDTKTVARVANEGGNDCATIRLPADFESYIRRDPSIFAQSKQPKILMDLIAAQKIEIWSLLQGDLESQVHAVIQTRVTGLIIYVGKDDGVLLGEFGGMRVAVVEEGAGGEEHDQGDARDDRQTARFFG